MENNKVVAECFIFDVKKEFVINKKKVKKSLMTKTRSTITLSVKDFEVLKNGINVLFL